MIKLKSVILCPFILSATLWFGFSAFAQDEDSMSDAEDAKTAKVDEDMEIVNVIGIRNPERSIADSTVPIDVINGNDLRSNSGSTDMLDQLASQLPSFNIEAHPIADAATLIRPATLRGLSADSTLILVNSKRRHRGAVIALLGGGKNQGAHGPDLTAIPALAVSRVEVLRNGASAQYGSDAIAGVMNFVLHKSDDIREGSVKVGQFLAGDGTSMTLSGIIGMPFGDGGSLTLSADFNTVEPTDRSTQRDDARDLIAAGNTHVREPHAQIWGSPEIKSDLRFFANAEAPMGNGMTFYGWGNYSFRDTEGGFFFRNPYTRSGVFTIDAGETALIADLGDDNSDCPTVAIEDELFPDEEALQAVFDDPNCYSFLSKFPGGFTPQFGGEITDVSIALGLRGLVFNDWDFDTSFIWGQSHVSYYMSNTINPQLVDRQDAIPTTYKPGEHQETDWVYDISIAREIPVASGHSDIYLATGFEVRSENFVTVAGEEESWIVNPMFASQGFGVGSNGFPGFPPSIEVDESRVSFGLWLDAEQELTSNIILNTAMRWEEYDDFGQTANIKVSTLIKYSDHFAVRSGAGTSFSAPTAGQSNIRIVTTNLLLSPICPDPTVPCLADEVTLPPTHPVAEAVGGERLQPVKANNSSLGFVFDAWKTDVTVDFFRIDVTDRLARTTDIPITAALLAQLEDEIDEADKSLSAIRFFTNNFDTRTEGVELVAARRFMILDKPTDFSFTASFIKTSVENHDPDLIDAQRVRELEKNYPKLRMTLSAHYQFRSDLVFNARARYYHDIWEPHVFTDTLPINVRAAYLIDLEGTYFYDENTTIVFGLDNALDTYPANNPWAGVVGAKYPITSPFGFDGMKIYVRAHMKF